jgi:hypothetical protein
MAAGLERLKSRTVQRKTSLRLPLTVEPVVVRGWEAPRSRASAGRDYVEFEDGHMAGYYSSVINAKVVVAG